jgi:HEAT repeat protein
MNRIGFLTTDTDLVVTTWDASLERMTGIAGRDARGRRLDEIVPDLRARGLMDLIREPLMSGSAQVLAPALHKFLIPCPPLGPSQEFDHMQQRVVVGALRDAHHAVGLVISIEDVTARLERERALARQLREASPAARLKAVEELSPLEPLDGIGPLRGAMADEDWRVRRAAVKSLAARRDAALVDGVIAALRDGHRDFSLLSSALELLTLTGVDSTKALVRLMDDPDADLRIQAALALGSQRHPEAIEALVRALDDPDPNVRFHAIEALGKLASPAAIDKLAAIAESRDFYLAFPALEALVLINDPVVAPRIAPLLGDPMLSAAAAEALGHVGDEDAVGPLVDALSQPQTSVPAVVEALTRIQHRYETSTSAGDDIKELVRGRLAPEGVGRIIAALESASGAVVRPLVNVLGWLDDPVIPGALVHLLGAEEARHDVVEAFVRLGSSAVPLLVDQLRAGSLDIRRASVVALGRIGDRRAVEPLIGVLHERDRDLWLPVASALARLGDERAFEPLLPLLGDGDVAVRQAVVGALNSIGHPDMAARIGSLLDHSDALVRESAVKIAGYFGYPECAVAILARCSDSDEAVRAAAIEHLPYFDDARMLGALAAVLDRDTPRARAAAAKALGAVVDSEALLLLRRAANDSDPWVRYFAASSLGRLGDRGSLDVLKMLSTVDPAPHVRIAAIDAIGAIGGDGALETLQPLMAGDGDTGLAAIRASGALRVEKAVAALSEVLRSNDAARRTAAVEAIALSGGEDAIEQLYWTASSDEDTHVVRAALNGLGSIANQNRTASRAAVRALVSLLSDSTTRSAAMAVAGRLAPSAIPVLAESLSTDAPPVRRGVVEALGRLSHSVASAYLQRALNDSDDAVRREAVRALSRLGTSGLTRRFAAMSETDFSPAVRQAAAAALSRQGVQEGGG